MGVGVGLRIVLLFDSPALFAVPRPEDASWIDASMVQVGQIERALRRLGHAPRRLAYQGDGRSLVEALVGDRPDLVLNLTQGRHCSDVARLLDLIGIPYTGADGTAIDMTTDKALTHDVLRANGVATPRYWLAPQADAAADLDGLTFPLIAKLRYGDGSYGVDDDSLIRGRGALGDKLRRLADLYDEPVLLEEFLDGRELSVSLLGNGQKVEVFPIRELDFSTMPAGASRICTYDAKWTHESVAYQRILSICPARLEPALERAVIDVSRRAWRLLGLRDYGRIDFRLDRRGRPVVIDVNTNPDLEEEVGFVVAAEHAGLGFDRTIGEVVAAALARPRAAAAVPTC